MKLVTHCALFSLLLGLVLLIPRLASAQSVVPLGSSQSVTAEPPVARPARRPVTVTLFRDFTFTDYAARPFSFTPPANHGRRWAKIVLVCDFSVSAGRQFDPALVALFLEVPIQHWIDLREGVARRGRSEGSSSLCRPSEDPEPIYA